MFLGEEEYTEQEDNTRRFKVVITALGIAFLVLMTVDYFN
jgi:hypothetical protein